MRREEAREVSEELSRFIPVPPLPAPQETAGGRDFFTLTETRPPAPIIFPLPNESRFRT